MLAAKSRATIGAGASTSADTTRCLRLSFASILTCRACSQIFGQKRDCSQSILRHPREVLSHCLIDSTSTKMWVCSSECRHGLRTHWCFEVPIFYYANTRDIHNACVPAVAYSIMLKHHITYVYLTNTGGVVYRQPKVPRGGGGGGGQTRFGE